MSFPPTAEQAHIHDLFRTGQTIKVRAGAGTGKTTTLQQLAAILGEQQRLGLYLAFNKSIATEAGRKFPRHVTTSTAHAMAFKGIRATRHADLLSKMQSNQRIPFHITGSALGIGRLETRDGNGERRMLSQYQLTRHVLRTVEEFCKTTDLDIGRQHVPPMTGLEGAHAEVVGSVLPRPAAPGRTSSTPAAPPSPSATATTSSCGRSSGPASAATAPPCSSTKLKMSAPSSPVSSPSRTICSSSSSATPPSRSTASPVQSTPCGRWCRRRSRAG